MLTSFLLIYQSLISYIELLKTEGHRPSNCHLLLIVLETGSARPRSRQVLCVWRTPFFFPLGCCFFSVPRQGRKMPENVNSSNATSTHGFIYPLLFPKAVPPNSITLACGPTLKSGDHLVPTSQCVVWLMTNPSCLLLPNVMTQIFLNSSQGQRTIFSGVCPESVKFLVLRYSKIKIIGVADGQVGKGITLPRSDFFFFFYW